MKNSKKVLLFLIITGWIRVLFILGPIAYVWAKTVTTDTEMIKK
jgi:hypothetical protein